MKKPLLKPGLGGLLEFTVFLQKKNVIYSIHQYDNNSLTIFFTVVGARFEVSFFEDRVHYSYFRGSEDCFYDEDEFMNLFDQGRNG